MRGIICIFFAFCTCFFAIAQTSLVSSNRPLPNLGKTFSIVAHIVSDSSGTAAVDSVKLKDEIALMNKYFSPIGVKFEICKIDNIPNYTLFALKDEKEYGELLNQYRLDKRINMYFVQSYPAGEMFGEAKFNGISKPDSTNILVLSAHASAARMAHLMGHFFGLVHTFDIRGEFVDGSNCTTTGDKICDTPADPFEEGSNPLDDLSTVDFCRFTGKSKDFKGQYYVPDVGNIMSMYFPCYCSFSQDQLRLMAENYINSADKLW
jgi:hypothetical protein